MLSFDVPEVAWDDALSIHGRNGYYWKCPEVSWPGLGADGRDSLCDMSLWARLLWSAQPGVDTQRRRQDSPAFLVSLTYSVSTPES